ncbi:cholesterol 24-hydroxylase-like isoform X1 [Ptychodera flava]|uniref:cholesterol 24-hydroxylase-like isoform X1 n=1 Tax=Ptychodera flava TaxID=63121 RepID=UPI003969F2D0
MALNLFTLGYLIACICVVILLPLVITGLLYLLYIAYIRLKFAHMPGPKYSSFFFGNLADVKRGFADGKTFPTIVYEWSQKYGRVFTFAVLHETYVMISDVVAVKHLLVTVNCPKGARPYDTLGTIYGQRFMGHGLVSERCHEKWAKRRAIINPAFHRRFLRLSMDQFNASVDMLIGKLKQKADGKSTVSMLEEFYRLGLEIIGKVAFGTDFNVILEVENHFVEANQVILSALLRRMRSPLEDYNPWSRGHREEVRAAVKFLRKTGRDVVEKRLAARLNGEEMKEDDVLGYILKASDYLKNPEFQMEDVVDDFVTFFLAGQETTANTAAFMLMELVRNPDILERVREEIKDVLCGRMEVKFEDLAKFSYMSQVVKETLRMYPTAPVVPRFLEKEETVAGFRIPANSSITIDLFSMARHEGYFEDADTFNPDRFNGDEAIIPNTSIPFSMGPRNCIGQNFAQIEIKVIFAKLLPLFDFSWIPGQSYDIGESGTLKPKEGCQNYITLR